MREHVPSPRSSPCLSTPRFDLMGKTFSGQDRDKENQWFEQFVIRQNGATVLDASAKAPL